MHLATEETKNANIDNNQANIGDLIEKSKDFTISISEIHRYTAEIRGFIWISRSNIANKINQAHIQAYHHKYE